MYFRVHILLLYAIWTKTRSLCYIRWYNRFNIWHHHRRTGFVHTRYWWNTSGHLCIWYCGRSGKQVIHNNLYCRILEPLYCPAYWACIANAFQWPYSLLKRSKILSRLDSQWSGLLTNLSWLWRYASFFPIQTRRWTWLIHIQHCHRLFSLQVWDPIYWRWEQGLIVWDILQSLILGQRRNKCHFSWFLRDWNHRQMWWAYQYLSINFSELRIHNYWTLIAIQDRCIHCGTFILCSHLHLLSHRSTKHRWSVQHRSASQLWWRYVN